MHDRRIMFAHRSPNRNRSALEARSRFRMMFTFAVLPPIPLEQLPRVTGEIRRY